MEPALHPDTVVYARAGMRLSFGALIVSLATTCACSSRPAPVVPKAESPLATKTAAGSEASGRDQAPAVAPRPEYPRPKPEIASDPPPIELPAVPDLTLPPSKSGARSVREMRVRGRKLFGTKVEVEGVISWIYNCADELRQPGMSKREVAKLIREQPERCSRPHFFLAERKDAPAHEVMWVVEVPRKLRRDERKRLTRAELKALPPVPRLAVGDRVIVQGHWDQRSPAGFFNSDGLLMYRAIRNARRRGAK